MTDETNQTDDQWLELFVEADQEASEAVAEIFAQYGHNGGVVIEPPWVPTAESDGWVGVPDATTPPPPAYRTRSDMPYILRTYLKLDEHTTETRHHVEQALWHLGFIRPVGALQIRTIREEDWANAWRTYYQIQHIGKHLVIVPSWLEYTPAPDDVVLLLDPGMAFGTGLHPTTQLCLQLLEEHIHTGMAVFDIGTGSGVLAIAAARLGCGSVLAIDNDPIAVEVARQNVQHNALNGTIEVALGSLGVGISYGTYPLIVANIIAQVLIALAPHVAHTLQPHGILICSGIIAEREDEVATALVAAGLRPLARHQAGDWVALVYHQTDV